MQTMRDCESERGSWRSLCACVWEYEVATATTDNHRQAKRENLVALSTTDTHAYARSLTYRRTCSLTQRHTCIRTLSHLQAHMHMQALSASQAHMHRQALSAYRHLNRQALSPTGTHAYTHVKYALRKRGWKKKRCAPKTSNEFRFLTALCCCCCSHLELLLLFL